MSDLGRAIAEGMHMKDTMLVVCYNKADFEEHCRRHGWKPGINAKPVARLEHIHGKINGTEQPITRTDDAHMNREWNAIYSYVTQRGGQFL